MLDRDWGGSKPTPQTKISVTSVGVVFDQWGVKFPQPPPNKSNTGNQSMSKNRHFSRTNLLCCYAIQKRNGITPYICKI